MTTVVSALYPIQSKFPLTQYLVWVEEFLKLEAPIVLFTESTLAPTLRSLRTNGRPLEIVERPFSALAPWVLYEQEWKAQSTKDHERYHTPELYAIWAAKAWFVAEVARRNPFGTSHFFWCDAGAFRQPMLGSMRRTFPRTDCLPADRILLCSIEPLVSKDWNRKKDGIRGKFQRVNRIVGGLWGGPAEACIRWHAAYESQLIRYFTAGRFAGKDQSVMLSAYLEDPTLARIVRPTTSHGDHWFFLQYALSENGPLLESDTSYIRLNPPPPPVLTVPLMGGLGNQLFQVAAVWAHARRHDCQVRILRDKQIPDGRPTYWDTILHRFQHMCGRPPYMPSWWEPGPTEYAVPPTPSSLGLALRGYFQSPGYFEEFANELRALFRPSAEIVRNIQTNYANLLELKDRMVVVHARRTDYCASPEAISHHGPLSVDYYNRALERFPDSIFLLVADDPLWWMEAIPQIPVLQKAPFHILIEPDEIMTFGLLQQFQNFVLANSTFSWWAAWMVKGSRVIAPAQWFGPTGPKQFEDLYCRSWERV